MLLAAQPETLKAADRALTHELVLGVLRWQRWLDLLIEHYANRKILRLDAAVQIALRLGLYQLRFLTRIPSSAAVNESVNLVRLARLRSAESFVNAVLRRATREPEYDPSADVTDPVERLAIETSHPTWLINRWIELLGVNDARAFAIANNQPPPIAFRIVRDKATEAEILDQLRSSGASLSASEIAEGGWRINGGGPLLKDLTRAGEIYLQDEGSQLVTQVLNTRAHDLVLDVCAAPGSKTTQIADSPGSVRVVAADLHQHRLKTVSGTATLHGLANIFPVVLDGLEPLPFPEGSFDSVLVDAPCSGTGTLRHNPEIRWRISAEDIRDLSQRQKQLLINASRVVKTGGRLVYSTCSVEPEENEAVTAEFLRLSDQFVPVNLLVKSSLTTSPGMARTWPHRDGVDGFFIAAFQRKGT